MTDDLRARVDGLKALAHRRKYRAVEFFEPYEKQKMFMHMGGLRRERLFVAGNQVGKTLTGATETSYHLTGQYPTWWTGRRFPHATRGWCIGVSWSQVRDVVQGKLMGSIAEGEGTGTIPKDLILGKSMLARPSGVVDTLQVRHVSGGVSSLKFMCGEQEREKFQGEPIDFAWCDEEPPMKVYTEVFARTIATGGMVYTTFTPLNGRTELYESFASAENSPTKFMITMRAADAAHLTPERIRENMAGFPEYEHEARLNGIPLAGEGRVFKYSREAIMEAPNEFIPMHWAKIWGVDFGIAHPFGASLIAWDKDADVIHVLATHRVSDQTPREHCVVLKQYGTLIPIAWPQDGTQRDKGSGIPLADQYRKLGAPMLKTPAMWPMGGNSTEAGILEMDERMKTGRLKVASHLADWFEEFMNYSRTDGEINKVRDDIMSSTRIALMMKRYAQPVPLAQWMNRNLTQGWSGQGIYRKGGPGRQARGTNFDLFDPSKDED